MKAKAPQHSMLLMQPPTANTSRSSSSNGMSRSRSMSDDVSVCSTFTRERPSLVKQQKEALRVEHVVQRRQRSPEDTDATVAPPEQAQPELVQPEQPQQPQVKQQHEEGLPEQQHLTPAEDDNDSSSDEEDYSVDDEEQAYHHEPLTPLCPPHEATRVHFQLDQNTEHGHGWQYSEMEMQARWYQAEDYKLFKQGVINIVKAVMKAQIKRQQHQQKQQKSSHVFTYSAVLERTYNACFQMELEHVSDESQMPICILTKPELHDLRRCFKTTLDAECVLGLERLLVQRIGKDRAELRGSLFGIIVDLQTTPWPHHEVLADNICQISQEVSRPARLFARHLALAQWMAPCKEETPSVPRKSKSAHTPRPAAPQRQERRFSN